MAIGAILPFIARTVAPMILSGVSEHITNAAAPKAAPSGTVAPSTDKNSFFNTLLGPNLGSVIGGLFSNGIKFF